MLSTLLGESEKQVLVTLFDALFADIGEEKADALSARLGREGACANYSELKAYARRPASACGDVFETIDRIAERLRPDKVRLFVKLFQVLATPAGGFFFAGRWAPVHKMGASNVQQMLRSCFASVVPAKRLFAKQMKQLAVIFCIGATENDGSFKNVNWHAMGYEGPGKLRGLPALTEGYDFTSCRPSLPTPRAPPGGGAALPVEISCDCVIVGSGVGGSIVAAELAEAGLRVVMIETKVFQKREDMTCLELDALGELYQEGGIFATEDDSVNILAGAAFGGGSAVNWFCSLPPPHHLCEEWARDFGLQWAAGPVLSDAVEKVRERLGIHTSGVRHNCANQLLAQGCDRLGYQWEVAAQQGWPERPGDGGWCTLGWKHGRRQGMHGSALLDAAQTGNLIVVDACWAQEVLRDGTGRACGVRASLQCDGSTCELLVHGRAVVAAGGALQTPGLLKRSGMKSQHVGRHLTVHPACNVYGIFDEPVRFFEGAPMTAVSRVVEDLDGDGYGAKIEVPIYHPVVWSAQLPWWGPEDFKELLAGYSHALPLICIVRDKSEGSVIMDKQKRLRVSYSMNRKDRDHMTHAFERAARILVAAGAREVHTCIGSLEPLKLAKGSSDEQEQLEAWLARLRSASWRSHTVSIGSAHQMGTCRMASSPRRGAAKPTGETWEIPGLFVADTSTFPTASGVNPMFTCASVAYLVAQNIKEELQATASAGSPKYVPAARL